MNGFSGPLDLRAHTKGEWVVLNTIQYTSLEGITYGIPSGFITDLASIPPPLRGLYDRNDETRLPAVLHDTRYCVKRGLRKYADDLFLEAMERCGVGFFKRWSMYLAVRACGWAYWNRRNGMTAEDFINE
jgi:hypothetical protein